LNPKYLFSFIFLFATGLLSNAQDSSRLDNFISFPDKLFGAIDKKARGIEEKLDRQTIKYLNRLEKQEQKLKRKLWKKDSLLASKIFSDVKNRYQELKTTPVTTSKYSSLYSGHFDSLTTSLNFLQSNDLTDNPQKALSSLKDLKGKLNASEQIRKQLMERQKQLKEQFQKLGMVKELKKFRKEVYYYQAQVRVYKEAFEDPNKLEAKLMELVQKLPQFKEFFARNSQLGSLFALPGSSSGGGQVGAISLAGLQTRASLQQLLIDRFGTGPNVTQVLQQNVQSAQGQLNALKAKAQSYISGSFGNASPEGGGMEGVPEGFTPNTEKTKSFLKRLEVGTNLQSQKARTIFPVTTDMGLSLGYKLNEKSVIGIGASYKLGWGSGFNNIDITHQGVALRSYLDWKIKGGLFISGGYELNHRPLLANISFPSPTGGSWMGASWQKSGLIGLSKKYKLSSPKRGRSGGGLKGNMQLLWDFLSYEQVPKTQAIVFRIGYSLK